MAAGAGAVWALAVAVFVASVVETVEAVTIVVAMGMTRGWRSAIAGTVAALVALVGFTAVAGYALVTWLPEAALQVVIGALLLAFGLQWLRKAILRSAGLKSMHDEATVFAEQSRVARSAAAGTFLGLDHFAFLVSLKGVFLEGVEVVFIIITFGLSAKNMPVAIGAGSLAVVLVVIAARAAHGPLTRVPENTLKYAVAVLLTTFGSFWVIEGLGVFRSGHQPLRWPGGDVALLAVLLAWFGLSQVLIRAFRERRSGPEVAAELTGEGVSR